MGPLDGVSQVNQEIQPRVYWRKSKALIIAAHAARSHKCWSWQRLETEKRLIALVLWAPPFGFLVGV